MEPAVERRLLGLLGLGLRGRRAVLGVERVREAARRGTLRCVVVAADASRHSREKVEGMVRARGVTVVEVPSAARLGAVAGREATAAIGVVDVQLADGVRSLVGASVATRGQRGGRVEQASGE